MRGLGTFLLSFVTTMIVSPGVARAQASDRSDVLAAVNGFMRGLRAKDTALVSQHMDSLARMTLPRTNNAGTRLLILRAPELIRMVANEAANDEVIRNPTVQLDGGLAVVWAEYQVRREGRVTHCGFDSFQLAKLNGKWKIVNVADSFKQQGCGEPWK
jgi:hypothetical protein